MIVLIILAEDVDTGFLEKGLDLLGEYAIPFRIRYANARHDRSHLEEMLEDFCSESGKIVICLESSPSEVSDIVASSTEIPFLSILLEKEGLTGKTLSRKTLVRGVVIGEREFLKSVRLAARIVGLIDPDIRQYCREDKLREKAKIRELDRKHKMDHV